MKRRSSVSISITGGMAAKDASEAAETLLERFEASLWINSRKINRRERGLVDQDREQHDRCSTPLAGSTKFTNPLNRMLDIVFLVSLEQLGDRPADLVADQFVFCSVSSASRPSRLTNFTAFTDGRASMDGMTQKALVAVILTRYDFFEQPAIVRRQAPARLAQLPPPRFLGRLRFQAFNFARVRPPRKPPSPSGHPKRLSAASHASIAFSHDWPRCCSRSSQARVADWLSSASA